MLTDPRIPKSFLSLLVSGALALSVALAATVAMPFEQPAMARSLTAMPTSFTPTLVADVAEMVAPSVVNIDVEKTARVASPDLSGLPFGDDILRRFFGASPGGDASPFTPFGGNGGVQERTIAGNGSGMILDRQGHILTNNHVVASADTIKVTLNDGRQFPARVLGRDALSDVAVLKIEAPDLVPVSVGDSKRLRPGEWVIAVGSPLGFDHTVTLGIVSALSRRIPDINSNVEFIQTDAAINPGNSGGPLVNLKGEVIGINTAISGRGQNIGFAIPMDIVRSIADNIIVGKPVVRPWVGISMVELNPDLAKHVGLPPQTRGLVIAQVMENSPAYRAGLMQGDVIQKVDGKPVTQPDAVQSVVRSKPVNSKIMLGVLRNGHPLEVSLTSEQLPDSPEALTPSRPRVRPMPSSP